MLHGGVLWLPKEYLWLGIAASGSPPQSDFLFSLIRMYISFYFLYSLTLLRHAHTGVNSLTLFGGCTLPSTHLCTFHVSHYSLIEYLTHMPPLIVPTNMKV